MKWVSVTLTLLSVTQSAFAGDVFVLVESEGREQAYDLLDDGWAVIEAHPSFCLILCPEGRAGTVPDGRIIADGSETLYVIWNPGNRPLPEIAGTRIVDVPGEAQILVARVADAMEYAAAGAELKLVNKTPIRKPLERQPLRTVGDISPISDQLIHEMIGKVEPGRYEDIVVALSVGVSPSRYSFSKYIDDSTDYIYATFNQATTEGTEIWSYEPWVSERLQPESIFWVNKRVGYVPSGYAYIWITNDYGSNWDAYKCNGHPVNVKFTDENNGYTCGDCIYDLSFLGTTSDGGLNWSTVDTTDYSGEFRGITYKDKFNVIAFGTGGTYYLTKDGGGTWVRGRIPSISDIYSVSFASKDILWATAAGTEIYRSPDGGTTWEDMSDFVPSNRFNKVWFHDENNGVLTEFAGILYTEDGGLTWKEASDGQIRYTDDIYFIDSQTGWAAGSNGNIYRTDDGGKSWILQHADTHGKILSVFFVDHFEGWAMDENPDFFHTVDGGSSWVYEDLQLTNPKWDNVVAEFRGDRKPGEVIIICGHYDSDSENPYRLAPGAEDNASGSGGVIAAAEAMARYEYESTVRFVTFSGEEHGLEGSRAYAEAMAENGDNIVAVINMDMVAYLDEPVYDIKLGYNGFTELRDAVISMGAIYTPEIEIYAEDDGISDDWSFVDYGFPAVGLIEQYNDHFYPWIHTTDDLPEHLDFTYGAEVVKLAAATAACLAGITGRRPDDGETDIIAYPNPARPGDAGITFTNLPDGATLTLYNIAGERVFERFGIIGNETLWTLANDRGNPVASGVYVYRVVNGDGDHVTGKVAVIR